MSELTQDQLRVLKAISEFQICGPESIRAELRCAFVELKMLRLIKPITVYHLTDAGHSLLCQVPKENADG